MKITHYLNMEAAGRGTLPWPASNVLGRFA